MLKSVFLITMSAMILCYIFYFLSMPLAEFLFPYGGVAESYLKPIYLGIIVLSGLITGCTYYIAKLIKGLSQTKL